MSQNPLSNNNTTASRYAEDLTSADGAGFAAIFDMDGTLIHNTPYHFKAWQLLFKKYNMPELSRETYKAERVAAFLEEAAEVYERRGLFQFRY